jgi:hypothetical protein
VKHALVVNSNVPIILRGRHAQRTQPLAMQGTFSVPVHRLLILAKRALAANTKTPTTLPDRHVLHIQPLAMLES